MEITQVHFQRVVNLGNYENHRIGAWANVGAEETPEDALTKLEEWVRNEATVDKALATERDEAQQAVWNLRERVRGLEADIATATALWSRIQVFMARMGFDLPKDLQDDIPF